KWRGAEHVKMIFVNLNAVFTGARRWTSHERSGTVRVHDVRYTIGDITIVEAPQHRANLGYGHRVPHVGNSGSDGDGGGQATAIARTHLCSHIPFGRHANAKGNQNCNEAGTSPDFF